jgi:hypothetical protein
MLSLSEAKPSMVKKVPGWVEIMVRACLEAMGEFDEEEGSGSGLEAWLADDVSTQCGFLIHAVLISRSLLFCSLRPIPIHRIRSPLLRYMNSPWIGWRVLWVEERFYLLHSKCVLLIIY